MNVLHQDNRNISIRVIIREANQANTSILYLGLVGKDYIALNWGLRIEPVPVWSHVRRCTSVEDLFGRIGSYTICDFLDVTCYFSTISISQ
jgi:hypothetical protein